MSRPRPRALPTVLATALTAVLTAAAVLLAGPPAHDDRQTTTDAARDVYRVPAGGTPRLDRDDRAHDIVKAGAVHNGPTVTLWLEVRRLARTNDVASWYVRTPEATWWLHHDRRDGARYTSLFHAGGPEVLDCDGLRGRAYPRTERVVVRVPRVCIGRPAWIRFGASMGRETDSHHLIDDARIDAGFFSNRCRLGPRLRHN